MFSLEELEKAVIYLKSKNLRQFSIKSDDNKYFRLVTEDISVTLFNDNASMLKIQPTISTTEKLV